MIGFGAVLDWLKKWDFQAAEAHAVELAEQSKVRLKNYPNCRLFNSPQPSSVVCFVFDGIAASDPATLLSEQKIEQQRCCSQCGGDWTLNAPLFDVIYFKCDQCRLVSNVSWNFL